jgi:prepilin-type N-terminal cleavage/methylation domain-containing protein
MQRIPKSAFTLIELSIVLVIIGLLVGGILAGRTLIRAAELGSIVTQPRAQGGRKGSGCSSAAADRSEAEPEARGRRRGDPALNY